MDGDCARWSDLLPELWTAIGKHLDTYIDVIRCRAVCRSLRASFPPFDAIYPFLPLPLPYLPNNDDADSPAKEIFLARKIIYRFGSLDRHGTTTAGSSSAESAAAKVWFGMVDNTKEGKLRFLRPVHLSNFDFTYRSLRNEMNLLEFRIHEMAKSYTIVNTEGVCISEIRKVVMFPDSPWIESKNCGVLAIFRDGKLGFAKLRDNKWRMMEERNFAGGDVIVYRGTFYAVDRRGIVFSIDTSSMELSQVSAPVSGFGKQKHLTECGGEVYVVDQLDEYSDSEDDGVDDGHYLLNDEDGDSDSSDGEEEEEEDDDFKVYRVDLNGEYCRRELEEVKNLGDEAIVLGNKREGSFSVRATEFEGFQGNCLYFPQNSLMVKNGF